MVVVAGIGPPAPRSVRAGIVEHGRIFAAFLESLRATWPEAASRRKVHHIGNLAADLHEAPPHARAFMTEPTRPLA
jgi:hypothetical protein